MADNAYLAPAPFTTRGESAASTDEYAAWCKGIREDGMSYLRQQPAYKYISQGLDIVNGEAYPSTNDALSDIRTDHLTRNIKELVASQTNIRIIPAFKTEVQEYLNQQEILNKSFMAWQGMTFTDRTIRRAWQYACMCGTGYVGIRYDPNYYYKGKGDIVLDAYGPLDVMPVGMGRQHNHNKAYALCHRVQMPIHEAWRLYPLYRDKIVASRGENQVPGGVASRAVRYSMSVIAKMGRLYGNNKRLEDEGAPWEMVNIYYYYIDDDSVNDTGREITMGKEGTSWSYVVPYVGQEIPTGKDERGRNIIKRALREDCLLYPNKRLIVSTEDDCLNPDPEQQVSPYWHARSPLVKFTADDWAWNYLGFPLTKPGNSIERSNIDILRAAVDAVRVRLNPPRAYNRNGQASSLMENIDTRVPGQVLGLDLGLESLSGIMAPLLAADWYQVSPESLALVEKNEQRIDRYMGVADAAALSRARQLPSGDSVEKLMETLGPVIKDQSRNMEESIRAMGEMWKSCFFQFITAKRRMQLLGPDGVTEEDYDYDPGTLIPQTVPDESLPLQRLTIDMQRQGDQWTSGGSSRFERARWHKDNFAFSVTPYSLHEFNSMTRKLFITQLTKTGFPLDWWTLAEMYDVKNFGERPMYEDPETGETRRAQTVMEAWVGQQEILARIQAAHRQPGAPGQGGGKGGKKSARGAVQGRPPSGQQPPTLEQKGGADGGTRAIVRESKR